MKKFILVLLICVFMTGCSVLEVADMVFDDDCIYRGTVSKVVQWIDTTTVTFESGKSVTCFKAEWVEVGDWIEARETETSVKAVFDVTCEFDR